MTGTGTASGLDAGTYEVLRDRLDARAAELARRAGALNTARVEAFGSTGLALAATDHLRTERDLLARDIVAVGDVLLVGYEAPTPGDVLALHDRDLKRLPDDAVPGLLDDPAFVAEFAALHRYFQGARLLRLRRVDGRLLAVFRTGAQADDIRVLRWSLGPSGEVRFLDARGERDHVLPAPYDFDWTATTRDDHVLGRHPHIAVADGAVFVSTVGGTLTVKTENDTETGEGVHSEPVDEPLQSLADAEVAYAVVGALVLLRVRPYKEQDARHLVFNTLTGKVLRLDGVGQACRRLPDGQGVVFPGGYCLATGTAKAFDTDTSGLEFERAVRSPNGEDVLYVFHSAADGRSLLLPYNLIRKEVAAPIACRGHALLDDGTLAVLRGDPGESGRVHPVQLWHTPYVTGTVPEGEGPLARIGNADLVRGISDCLAIARQVAETTATGEMYAALVAACTRAADRFPWLGDADAGDLRTPLDEVRDTAEQVLREFATVRDLTGRAAEAVAAAAEDLQRLVRRVRGEAPATAAEWIDRITELRRAQGRLVTLKEMRYADTAAVDALAEDAAAHIEATAQRAVVFLGRDDAFAAQHAEVERLTADAGAIATTAEAAAVTERLDAQVLGLQTLTEVVAGLDIGDPTVRTAILERTAEVLGGLNRARALLAARRRELVDQEGRAAFAAEFALLAQSVTGALAAAGTPEACDEQLARLLLQLDNLESRFADHDGFLAEIADKRAEVHDAFAGRKQTLQDTRARRAERLARSAERVLETIARRAAALDGLDAVNTYFASDPMVAKVRRTAGDLRELGDQVRAEELEGRLKAARQEAGRALRDRVELYADGGDTIRLGAHRFAVNTRPPELTLVPHADGGLAFALTGTDYRRPVTDSAFAGTRAYWDQLLPSENADVYRGEYLAARLLDEHGAQALAAADLALLARETAEAAYDEGYERGVHDHDAAAILAVLLRLGERAGLLRHPAADRAAAQLFWAHGTTPEQREGWTRAAVTLVRAREAFGTAPGLDPLRGELAEAGRMSGLAAAYLVEELAAGGSFTCGPAARDLLEKFHRAVGAAPYAEDGQVAGQAAYGEDGRRAGGSAPYAEDVRALLAGGDVAGARRLVEGWLHSYAASCGENVDAGDLAEAVAIEVCPDLPRHDVECDLSARVEGLLGTHPRIERGVLRLRLDEFLTRTGDFARRVVPGFRAYQRARNALVAAERDRLRLDEYRPRVMSSFVRGRLVDEVYLPLVGDNLAKQIGVAGDAKRADTSGLLLLLSPPGYGKTTLIEYVADRLGLLLVKVDGPALGHDVTSLDPAEAPNAAARREVEKIAFALSAGNNVLLYLDDIQHTSPELLQKFVPLCDATRTLNGHDLRGKRFAVCMAGNPYTESGQRFRVPDMLANRADVWNLGDVLTGKEDAFALSFVENALTSHPVLAPLAGRERADLELLLRLAAGDGTARRDRLAHPYAPAELDSVLAVLRHLLAARETVLAVNAAYIASAGQADAGRAEPPFQLQGSYRNMNKIAARISPVMNVAELAAVIDDHYTAEAQTLTSGAEANLLKLAALRGTLTPEQRERWAAVTAAYVRDRALGGAGGDALGRAVAALGLLADRVAAVEAAINRAVDPRHAPSRPSGRHAAREEDGVGELRVGAGRGRRGELRVGA
ncbi:DNA repair ATPase [Streptomyces thermolilacinus]|uniref:DNA repair ATPase n=1 Tax=Streptomyces thermolilacinus SPC6 TaxID=1306406 RepID=A0A1D3DST5_9ACTN|nr:DNA repair ATPase [Streptomyces thermolilacinus]OEJ95387.1 DNA repair ATPase [Streptomyces thermolilacinus SPC6]